MNRLADFLRRAVIAIPGGIADRCVVFGSAPMVLAGSKDDSNDLDLFVDAATYATLSDAGYKKVEVKPGVWAISVADDVEVYEVPTYQSPSSRFFARRRAGKTPKNGNVSAMGGC